MLQNGLNQQILKGIIWAVTISYPFLVWFSLDYFQPRSVALALAGLFLLRLLSRSSTSSVSKVEYLLVFAGGLFLLVAAMINQINWLLAYPVFVSLLFFSVFSFSLFYPPSVVERLARLEDPDLPPKGVAYTRKVTLVWSVFFLANAAMSLFTIWYEDRWLWSLYNGCISYVLMGLLMAAEMSVRRKIKASY
ncbi:hypothetical protein A1359_06085 [Methylomonas lenta]|uniref:DNA gyrase subunit B n=1 Tax=Methylomonas lenta TaxID=980561 RepID=A0A177NH05_9GAMM|nr:hypothetical protein [Methylomonas lenta]OAI17386.1 hypothetical protein A1359_06085 [Methylomonas lenta]